MLQPLDFGLFVLRAAPRRSPVDADLGRNRRCRPSIVAGDHGHGQAQIVQLIDGGLGFDP